MSQYPAILFFGPPGSGKGTQAEFLSQLTGHYHLSAGDIFRAIPKDSEMGRLQSQYLQRGLLIPDHLAVDIWKQHILSLVDRGCYRPNSQLLFADGMPRTAEQARLLRASLFVKAIISLAIDDEDHLISRLRARAIIEKRVDDQNLETLKTRLRIYTSQTEEVLQTFPQEMIITIAAKQRPFEVTRDILNQIDLLLKYPSA